MDNLWVPVAREVPIRAKDDKEKKRLRSGGEPEGAFMRELPQKQYGEKTEDKVMNKASRGTSTSC